MNSDEMKTIKLTLSAKDWRMIVISMRATASMLEDQIHGYVTHALITDDVQNLARKLDKLITVEGVNTPAPEGGK